MIEYGEQGAGFSIRIELHGEHKLMRIDAYGRWDRTVTDAFCTQARQLCMALSGQRWAAIWEAHAFPAQKPYILASLERMRREAVGHGMCAAAVLGPGRSNAGHAAQAVQQPRFENEQDALVYALSARG